VAAAPSALDDARNLVKERRFEEAQAAFEALTQKDPKDPAAWKGLGDAYAGSNLKLEAMESYRKSLDLNPGDEELKAWFEKYYRPK